jgi:hypothetical protein
MCRSLKIKKARFLLPFLGITYFVFINNNHNNYYILGIISFIDSIIILSNLIFLLEFTNAKPLYYEDLYIDCDKLPTVPFDRKRKKLCKNIYSSLLVLSNSILFSALVCYWTSKIDNNSSFLEIIGVTGGLIEIAACFNSVTAKFSLFIIKKFIKIQIAAQYSMDESEDIFKSEGEFKSEDDISDDSSDDN